MEEFELPTDLFAARQDFLTSTQSPMYQPIPSPTSRGGNPAGHDGAGGGCGRGFYICGWGNGTESMTGGDHQLRQERIGADQDGDDVSIMRMPERASYRQAATTPSRKAARALSSTNVARAWSSWNIARPMSSRVAVRAPSPRFTARASSRHTRRARAPSRNSARPPSRHATRASASSRFMARLTSRNSVREARGDGDQFPSF